MKYTTFLASFIISSVHGKSSGELCRGTAERAKDGNWYCSEVWAITYRNISQAGAYNRTTYVDPRSGICGHEQQDYPSTGPLAPLFGEVSMHLRGPMNVSQLAVYQLRGEAHTMRKRNLVPFYTRRRPRYKRDVDRAQALVTMSHLVEDVNNKSSEDVVRRETSDWSRVAYYTSAAPAQATGLSFLANLGDPQKSGTFDYAFGNSLSYVTSNGGTVASGSMPFEGTLNTSEIEIAVFSDRECDSDCPYWRPDATSHFGWSGSSKAFFIEFQMDHYQNHGDDQGLISDAPAWWFLNAAIPRVLQYGNDRNNIPCSCWSTGCGEFDAFEVLGNGEERAKSTFHRQGNLEGGDSNYFKRPVGRILKFAVVWHYPHITALVLDDDFDFSVTLTDDQIQRLVAYDADSSVHSLFAIGD